jgi:hypothetical protein
VRRLGTDHRPAVPRSPDGNAYQRELASNGPYQFFAAFRNNELDYTQFYATLGADDVGAQMHHELAAANARFTCAIPRTSAATSAPVARSASPTSSW